MEAADSIGVVSEPTEPRRLSRQRPSRAAARTVLAELEALDVAIYQAVARTPTPTLDRDLGRLSDIADHSKLWVAVAALLAATGQASGRRAAVTGLLSIGAASATVNLGLKPFMRRHRPDRVGHGVPVIRHVDMPGSTSFPSGHSASAFAFATAAGHEVPLASLPLRILAATVAYSRIHTGVHYPGDVAAGSVIGGVAGGVVVSAAARRRRVRRRSRAR